MDTCQLCSSPAAPIYKNEPGGWAMARPQFVPTEGAPGVGAWCLLKLCSEHWAAFDAGTPEKRRAMGTLIVAKLSREKVTDGST